MFVHVHGGRIPCFIFLNNRGLRLPGPPVIPTAINCQRRRWLPIFYKDQDIFRVTVDRRAPSMVPHLDHSDRRLPRPASVFAPTYHHPIITPYRQHRPSGCDDYIGIALIIEQALLLKDRFAEERGQQIVRTKNRKAPTENQQSRSCKSKQFHSSGKLSGATRFLPPI